MCARAVDIAGTRNMARMQIDCLNDVSLIKEDQRERSIAMLSRNFFTELKRRNVYRVAVAYAVVAWLAVQATLIGLPPLEPRPCL